MAEPTQTREQPADDPGSSTPSRQRSTTESMRRLSKEELGLGRLVYPAAGEAVERPRTRADCAAVARPCPFVGCRYHVYLDVGPTGSIKLNFPGMEPWEMPAAASCVLDVADRGGQTLEEVGAVLNFTRERGRQVEAAALAKLRAGAAAGMEGADVEMPELWAQGLGGLAAPDVSGLMVKPKEEWMSRPKLVAIEEAGPGASAETVTAGPEWVNVSSAAEILGRTRSWVEALARQGRVSRRRGEKGEYEYRAADLEAVKQAPRQRPGTKPGSKRGKKLTAARPAGARPPAVPAPAVPRTVAVPKLRAAATPAVPPRTPPAVKGPTKLVQGDAAGWEEVARLLEQARMLFKLWVDGDLFSRMALAGVNEAVERIGDLVDDLKG